MSIRVLGKQWVQPTLPGMEALAPPTRLPVVPSGKPSAEAKYVSPHEIDIPTREKAYVPNRLPMLSHNERYRMRDARYAPRQEEFVPTEKIKTTQTVVHEPSVQHQVKHANPLALNEDPFMTTFRTDQGETGYNLRDGNHRVNAALIRGQLLIPASVSQALPAQRRR